MKPRSEDDLIQRERRRRQADAEFARLKERWPELRAIMSAEAITLAWFLLGDRIFDSSSAREGN